MNEAEARAWLNVPRETIERLEAFSVLLREESAYQNIVAKPTLDALWSRHIVDSAQLLRFAPDPQASWIDLGSGAGFPGLIVALLHAGQVILVEERRLRVEFLHRGAEVLGIVGKVEILGTKAERVAPRDFGVISARAFAPLPKLLDIGTSFSTIKTRWILPKGRNARSELDTLDASWQGAFRVEPSLTDPESGIIVADAVRRQGRASR
jgi:16S rRNA (guanine527-N7)-methyltransferase